jgi:hypothetical protein
LRVFDYECAGCGHVEEVFVMGEPDGWLPCGVKCGELMSRKLAVPAGRVRGRADGNDRNDADRFTADALGIRETDLPANLKRDYTP